MSDSKPSDETLLAASLTFGVLGKALYRELDNEELDQLLRTRVFTEIPFGEGQADSQKGIKELSDWTEENADGLSQDSCNDIRHDFLYLFAGVGRPLAAPWESTYCNESRTMFEKQTLQVRDWYKEYGLMIGRKNKEPDDQIGYELSFIAHVAHVASEASKSGDSVELEDLLDAIRDFLCQHLLRWAFTWSTRVQKNARSNFYKGLALLVSGSLQALSLELGIKAQDVKQCVTDTPHCHPDPPLSPRPPHCHPDPPLSSRACRGILDRASGRPQAEGPPDLTLDTACPKIPRRSSE